jgi:hypothetical protein
MFYIIGDIWTVITVRLIGGVLKLAWFLTRIAWYLTVFLVLSLGSGLLALTRKHGQDENAGAGEYADNGRYWRDSTSGTLYPIHATQTEQCEVHATDRGVDWRKSALSRLMRSPAIISCQFDAVADTTEHVTGSARFSRHARHGIAAVDDLDPADTEPETAHMNESQVWAGDRQQAATALDHLDAILTACGWQATAQSDAHWYSRRYQRPVILWDQPLPAADSPAIPTATQ